METLPTFELCLLIAIITSFVIMVYFYFKGQQLYQHGVRADGTITDHWTEEYDSGDPEDVGTSTNYYLKAFFTGEEGFVHSLTLDVSKSIYKKGKKAMALKLIYPPGQPKKARPNHKYAIHSSTIAWGAILFGFICAYAWVLLM